MVPSPTLLYLILGVAVLLPLGSFVAILLFAKPAVCEPVTLSLFSRNHRLTKTEEHVLGILCLGYSTPEIAVHMNVAVSTVRSHVRSLCAKTGSCGVRGLVNLVAVLPPVASSQRSSPVH